MAIEYFREIDGEFMKLFSQDEREFFVRAAVIVTLADGDVRKSEVEIIKKVLPFVELNEQENTRKCLNDKKMPELKILIGVNYEKIFDILEGLLVIAWSDGEIAKNELSYILTAAKYLGIAHDNQDLIQKIIQFIKLRDSFHDAIKKLGAIDDVTKDKIEKSLDVKKQSISNSILFHLGKNKR